MKHVLRNSFYSEDFKDTSSLEKYTISNEDKELMSYKVEHLMILNIFLYQKYIYFPPYNLILKYSLPHEFTGTLTEMGFEEKSFTACCHLCYASYMPRSFFSKRFII